MIRLTSQQRLYLLLTAAACVLMTWLISSTMGPPVSSGGLPGSYQMMQPSRFSP